MKTPKNDKPLWDDSQASRLIGYMRVSTDDQNHDLQRIALTEYGCEKIFSDTISGSKFNRKGLDDAIAYLQPGDTLVVWKLDRLGRRAGPTLVFLDQLRQQGIYFHSIQEKFDTSTPTGRALVGMLSVFAELEREVISERITAGLAAAKTKGAVLGRKPRYDHLVGEAFHLFNKDATIRDVAALLGVSKTVAHRFYKAWIQTPIAQF